MRHSTVAASMIGLVVSILYVGSIAPVSRAQEATPQLEELPAISVTFSKAWSSGDPEQLAAIYAENALFEEVVLGGAVTHSRDELRVYAAAVYAAFPNFTATPVSAFVSDNRAVVEWNLTGTYSGQFGPLPPGTGQQVDVRVASVLVLTDDGLIQRDSEYWDFATVLTQLGVMPEAEASTTPAS
jgi:steroid delta-isomerase-like uncharacterized protein